MMTGAPSNCGHCLKVRLDYIKKRWIPMKSALVA